MTIPQLYLQKADLSYAPASFDLATEARADRLVKHLNTSFPELKDSTFPDVHPGPLVVRDFVQLYARLLPSIVQPSFMDANNMKQTGAMKRGLFLESTLLDTNHKQYLVCSPDTTILSLVKGLTTAATLSYREFAMHCEQRIKLHQVPAEGYSIRAHVTPITPFSADVVALPVKEITALQEGHVPFSYANKAKNEVQIATLQDTLSRIPESLPTYRIDFAGKLLFF